MNNAFPSKKKLTQRVPDGYGDFNSKEVTIHQDGLTKREYFAGLAMQGLASDSANDMGYRTIANIAVDMADALLEALETKQ